MWATPTNPLHLTGQAIEGSSFSVLA